LLLDVLPKGINPRFANPCQFVNIHKICRKNCKFSAYFQTVIKGLLAVLMPFGHWLKMKKVLSHFSIFNQRRPRLGRYTLFSLLL
jgi:hypothetical protein